MTAIHQTIASPEMTTEAKIEATPPNAYPDFRPDGSELVLQLEQIPEGSSEALNALHDFHILNKSMGRMLHEHGREVNAKYNTRMEPLLEMFGRLSPDPESGIIPDLQDQIELSKQITGSLKQITEIHYKELYVVTKIRADIEKYMLDSAQKDRQLADIEAQIGLLRTEFEQTSIQHQAHISQRGVFERSKHELETQLTNDTISTDAANSEIQALNTGIEALTSLIGQISNKKNSLHNETEQLDDVRAQLLAGIHMNSQAIESLRNKIQICLTVISNNHKQYPLIINAQAFLHEQRDKLLHDALEMKQSVRDLKEKHNLAMKSETYPVTDYLEADAVTMKQTLHEGRQAASKFMQQVRGIKLQRSDIFEQYLDESSQQNVVQRMERDLFSVVQDGDKTALKKLATWQMPAHIKETEQGFYETAKAAYAILSELRSATRRSHAYTRSFSTEVPNGLRNAIDANGQLLQLQQGEFNNKAFAAVACVDSSDQMLLDTKHKQLTWEQVTDKYTKYREQHDPIVEGLVRASRSNSEIVFRARTDQANLAARQSSLANSIPIYTAQAHEIREVARKSAAQAESSHWQDIVTAADHGDEYAKAELLGHMEAYGRPHVDDLVLPPEHEALLRQISAAEQELVTISNKLSAVSANIQRLEPIGVEIRTKLTATKTAHDEEIKRYSQWSNIVTSEIEKSWHEIKLEMQTARDWLSLNGIKVDIDNSQVEEAMVEVAPDPVMNDSDWRPEIETPEQTRIRRQLRGILGKFSVRRFGLTVSARGR